MRRYRVECMRGVPPFDKGKSIAVPREVTSDYNLFDFMMRKQGVSIEKDFQLKKLGAAGIIAVMEKGEVEAALHWEAHVTRMLATGKYRQNVRLTECSHRWCVAPNAVS